MNISRNRGVSLRAITLTRTMMMKKKKKKKKKKKSITC